jgi:hypothetical protein
MSETSAEELQRLAIEEIPEIWEQVKSKIEKTSTNITLNHIGVYKGEPIIIHLFKLNVGHMFDVFCKWGQFDLSFYLKNHILHQKRK